MADIVQLKDRVNATPQFPVTLGEAVIMDNAGTKLPAALKAGYGTSLTAASNALKLVNGNGAALSTLTAANLVTVLGSTAVANATAAGSVARATFGNQSNGEHNCNNITSNGLWYYTSNGPANLGNTSADGALYTQAYSTAWVAQIAQDYRNGHLFVRGRNNGTWTSWLRIIDTDNIGSQSVATASKLGTATKGAANLPIYLNAGTPTPVTSLAEAYLSWGGKSFSGSYGPIDAAMVPVLGANRSAFAKAAGITVEYSRDGGTTWTDYGAADTTKTGLFSGISAGFSIGKADSSHKATASYKLRVTLSTSAAGIYTVLNKFVIYLSTNGSTGCTCTITARLQSNYEAAAETWVTFADKAPVSGWSGFNVINTSGITTYGNTKASQYGQIRFLFECTGGSETYTGLQLQRIYCFGGVGWTTPSTMAATGNLYAYDASQNATFPAQVTATAFKKSGGTSAQFLKADGSVDATAYYHAGNAPSFAAITGTISNAQMNAAIAALPAWTATPVDNCYLIRQDTGLTNTYGRIPFSALFTYIKGKLTNYDSLVSGPSSSVNNYIAVFDGTTGKVIKSGGKTVTELDSAIAALEVWKTALAAAKGSSTQPVYWTAEGKPAACSYSLGKSVPSDAVFTDTKNTAGTTTKDQTKLYFVGATERAANPQTYANSKCYIGTDNCLYSNTQKVLTEHQSLAAYAKLASPAFTGTPTAPTAAAGTNSTQIATTAFVQAAVAAGGGGGGTSARFYQHIQVRVIGEELYVTGHEGLTSKGYVPYLFRQCVKQNRLNKDSSYTDAMKGWNRFGGTYTAKVDAVGLVTWRHPNGHGGGNMSIGEYQNIGGPYTSDPRELLTYVVHRRCIQWGRREVSIYHHNLYRRLVFHFALAFGLPGQKYSGGLKASAVVTNLAQFTVTVNIPEEMSYDPDDYWDEVRVALSK